MKYVVLNTFLEIIHMVERPWTLASTYGILKQNQGVDQLRVGYAEIFFQL